jgi:hypothetical protein
MKQAKLKSSIIEEINKLNSHFLQDLAWLLVNGNIHHEKFSKTISFTLQEETAQALQWIAQLETFPNKSDYQNLPLGKYTEQLLRFYFEEHPRFKLHAFNHQLIDEGITVGEIDYLVEEIESKQFLHLELAIKYYLKVEKGGETVFLGPSTKDWFERKVEKLKRHQLQLLQTHHKLLPQELSNHFYKSKVLIKGSLFYGWEEWQKFSKDPATNGWWLHLDEIDRMLNESSFFKLITDKKEWHFPFRETALLSAEECRQSLLKRFKVERNEVMVVRYDDNQNPLDRGFIVRENWPD